MDNPTSSKKSAFFFHSTAHEIDFEFDLGAESTINNVQTLFEIHSFKKQTSIFKNLSKLASAESPTLTNHGKIQLSIIPTKPMNQIEILKEIFNKYST